MNSPDQQIDHAFWTIPGKDFTVEYPLGLFHEIDFQVNEGFRRIPHGGVETGGVLWGHTYPESIRIVTVRPIECEHAAGPAFVLSETDLSRLAEQMRAGTTDGELAGLTPVGFYVAHTRGALAMSDRDAALLDRFFPEPGRVVVLIKPEKFQPTRFAFVVRERDGQMDRSTAEHALILPLPGRASGGGSHPVESIPAPVRDSRSTPKPEGEPVPGPEPTPLVDAPKLPVKPASTTVPVASPFIPAPAPAIPRASELSNYQTPLPSVEEVRRRRESNIHPARSPEPMGTERDATRPRQSQRRSNLGFAGVLVLAALLGCAAGYWAYLQLPAAIIPVTVERRSSSLLVSWPPQQTRDAGFAAVRVDDGQIVALTREQKDQGKFEVKTPESEVKLELIAQHWLRDSRGIVRYVRGFAKQSPAEVQPAQNAPATPVSPPAGGPER